MQKFDKFKNFRRYVIPYFIFALCALIIYFANMEILQLSVSDEIIVALLGLLVIDTISERLGILGNIETNLKVVKDHVRRLLVGDFLKKRSEIIPATNFAEKSSEIWILAQTGLLFQQHSRFFIEKLNNPRFKKLRVILLNPESSAINTLVQMTNDHTTQQKIDITISQIEQMRKYLKYPNKFEVRYTDVFAPFSILAVDPNHEVGSMNVDYLHYRLSIEERPWFQIFASEDSKWFEYYKMQFEQIWNDCGG